MNAPIIFPFISAFHISTVWIRRCIRCNDAYTAAERGIGAGANADISAALANGNRFAVDSDNMIEGSVTMHNNRNEKRHTGRSFRRVYSTGLIAKHRIFN